MFNGKTMFAAPAFPLESIFDPTGAGDSFAGGFMGYLSKNGEINDVTIRQAVIYGSAMASFNVEAFSLERLRSLTADDISSRYKEFKALTFFESH
jgi:sugar/nucleoside kinase (ribokinase family)